jgi:hypothetical protein
MHDMTVAIDDYYEETFQTSPVKSIEYIALHFISKRDLVKGTLTLCVTSFLIPRENWRRLFRLKPGDGALPFEVEELQYFGESIELG